PDAGKPAKKSVILSLSKNPRAKHLKSARSASASRRQKPAALLHTFNNGSSATKRRTFSTVISNSRSRVAGEFGAQCGVITNRGVSHNGESSGNGSSA